MGTLISINVRAQNANMVQAIREAYPTAVTERHTQFFAIDCALQESDCPEEELRSLAARLKTDVIWLSFQSTVQAFKFFHWHNDAQLRCLIRACLHGRAPMFRRGEFRHGLQRRAPLRSCWTTSSPGRKRHKTYRPLKMYNARP